MVTTICPLVKLETLTSVIVSAGCVAFAASRPQHLLSVGSCSLTSDACVIRDPVLSVLYTNGLLVLSVLYANGFVFSVVLNNCYQNMLESYPFHFDRLRRLTPPFNNLQTMAKTICPPVKLETSTSVAVSAGCALSAASRPQHLLSVGSCSLTSDTCVIRDQVLSVLNVNGSKPVLSVLYTNGSKPVSSVLHTNGSNPPCVLSQSDIFSDPRYVHLYVNYNELRKLLIDSLEVYVVHVADTKMFVPQVLFSSKSRFDSWRKRFDVGYRRKFYLSYMSEMIRVPQGRGSDADSEGSEDSLEKSVKTLRRLKLVRDYRLREVKTVTRSGTLAFAHYVSNYRGMMIHFRGQFSSTLSSERLYASSVHMLPSEWRMLFRSVCYNRDAIDTCLNVWQNRRRLVQGAAPSKPLTEDEQYREDRKFVPRSAFASTARNTLPMLRIFIDVAQLFDRTFSQMAVVQRYTPGTFMRILIPSIQLMRAVTAGDRVGAVLAVGGLVFVPEAASFCALSFSRFSCDIHQWISEQEVSESRVPQGSIMSAKLFKLLFAFLSDFSLSTMFSSLPDHIKQRCFSIKEYAVSVVSEITMVESFFKFVTFLGDRLSKFSETGRLWDLFGGDPNLDKLLIAEEAIAYLTSPKRNSLMTGDPSRWASYQQLSSRLTSNLSDPEVKSNPVLVAAIITLNNEINLIRKGASTNRVAPLGLIIRGPPGIGKTFVVQKIENMVRAEWSIPRDMTVTLSFQPDSAHQIQPSLSLIVLINDAFQIKDEKCTVPTMSLMQTLVDTTLFKAEGASLAEKERSLIAPEIVIATTNCSSYDMTSATGGANKLDRRYHMVELEWTPLALHLASEGGYDVSLTHSHQKRLGLVSFGMGRMSNDVSQRVSLTIVGKKLVTHDESVFLRWIAAERKKIKTAVCNEQLPELCEHGIELPCQCDSPLDFQHFDVEKVEVVDPPEEKAQTYRRGRRTPQGAVHSRSHSPVPSQSTYTMLDEEGDDDFSDYRATSAYERYSDGNTEHVNPNDHSYTENFRRWLKWTPSQLMRFKRVSLMMGIAFAAVGIAGTLAYKAWGKPLQGNLHGVMDGVENVHSVQPKMLGNLPLWLGAPGKNIEILGTEIPISSDRTCMYCSMVALNVIQVPAHFFLKLYSSCKPDMETGFPFSIGRQPFLFDPGSLYRVPSADLAYYFTGSVLGGWTSIYPFLHEDGPLQRPAIINNTDVNVDDVRGGEIWYSPKCTVSGDCGRLLRSQGRVIGVHVAVFSTPFSSGVAVPVTKSIVDIAFDHFVKIGYCPVQLDETKPQGFPTLGDETKLGTDMNWCMAQSTPEEKYYADSIPIGCIRQRDSTTGTSRETTLHHIFNKQCGKYFPIRVGRAIQVVKDGQVEWMSPYVRRYNIKVGDKPIDCDLFRHVVLEMISEVPDPIVALTPLTWYDAFVGHPDNYLMGPKDYSKSVGPLNVLQGRSPKMAFVPLLDKDGFTVAPWFVSRMMELEEIVKSGKVPILLTKATMKDEPQTEQKYLDYKTRLFYVPEPEFNMLLKKYLKPLMVHWLYHSSITGFKIVINPGCKDWDIIAEDLLQFGGEQLYDADQSNFDLRHSSLIKFVSLFFCLLAKKYGYSPEDQRIVGVLLESCFRSVMMLENVFYLVTTRLASGLDITSFVNCTFNTLINRGCARSAMDKLGWPRSEPVRKHMFDAMNGDDLAIAFSKDISAVIDGQYMVDFATSLGYVMTGAEKTEPIPRPKKITEITFVKRNFVFHEGRWKAPLALESIFKALCYSCQTSVLQVQRDAGAVLCAYKELWLHGREVFEAFAVQCAENGLVVKTYDEYQKSFDEGSYFPWLGDTQIVAQGGSTPLALRGKTVGTDQHLIEHSSEPHSYLYSPACSAPDSIPWRRSGWFLPSTELDNINPTALTAGPTPVVQTAVVDMDSTKMFQPRPLVDEIKETSLSDFFARLRRIHTFSVNTTTLHSSTVSCFTAWSALPGVAKQTSQYRFYRGRPTVQVVYSGNPSVLGNVRMVAIPITLSNEYGDPPTYTNLNNATSFTRSSTMPHMDFDLSKPCCCELSLPFPSQFDYRLMSISDWEFHFVELTAMASADTAITPASITFEVYVKYEDMRFLGLIPQGGESGGKMSSFLSYSSYILSLIQHPYANVASKIAAVGSQIAFAFGYSRPMLEPTESVVARKHGNTAIASGQGDMAYHLGLDPAVGSNMDWRQYPLGTSTDMEVSAMTQRYSQVKLGWSGNPVFCDPAAVSSSFVAGTTWYPTWLCFASLPFTYWRGTLVYKLVIHSSPLIRWRIGVWVVPIGVAFPPSYTGAGDVLSTVVDVCGSTEVEIEVPFMIDTPWALVNPTAAGASDCARIGYYQIAAPSGPGATTAVPSVDLWIKGGKDFELSNPSVFAINRFRQTQGKTSKFREVQGGDSRAAMTFGEVVEHWGLLVKRPIWDASIIVSKIVGPTFGNTNYLKWPVDGTGPSEFGSVSVNPNCIQIPDSGWSFASYLRRAYMGYNGGSVHRFVLTAVDPATLVQITQPAMVATISIFDVWNASEVGPGGFLNISAGGGAQLYTKDDFMIEVGCPSRANANFKTPFVDYYNSADQTVLAFEALCPVQDTIDMRYIHFMAAMDDFSMGGLLMAPALKVR